MIPNSEPILEALQSLGLTALESETYAALVSAPGITGYGIAKRLGKPTANVYKALEGLTLKGAALTEDAAETRYTAVPPEEFVSAFVADAKRTGQTIIEQFKSVTSKPAAESIYSLHTTEQAEQRIESLIREATTVVAADASPRMLDRWATQLQFAGRDKNVLIKAYQPRALDNCKVFVDARGEEILARWRVQWFHIVGDGSEMLLTIYIGDDLARGVWTREPLLSVVYHEALISELLLTGLTRLINENDHYQPLREFLTTHFGSIRLDARGFDRLFGRFDSQQDQK